MKLLRITVLAVTGFMLSGCSAGDAMYATDPAGFFWGLWHGAISFIALIIHIFNDGVQVYEVHNSGGWYDFGFLIGVTAIWGASSKASSKSRKKKRDDKEWEEIASKVEIKIKRNLREWVKDEPPITGDNDDDELGKKVEAKLKRKIKQWAEED